MSAFASAERGRSPGMDLRSLGAWVGLAFVVVAVLVAYLGVYPRRGLAVPVGADATTYVWRAGVMLAEGPGGLRDASPFPFDANGANPDRAGTPALLAQVARLLGIDPWDGVMVLPAVGAAVVALAAGAVGIGAVLEPRWSVPLYAAVVGASGPVLLAANGYFDNLLVLGALLAASCVTLIALEDRRAVGAAVALLVGSASVHPIFAAVFWSVLLPFAVLLPWWHRGSHGRPGWEARRRLALILVLSALGGIALILAEGGLTWPSGRDVRGYAEKLSVWSSRLHLPWFAPPAVAGALGLLASSSVRRRRALLLWTSWLLFPAAAVLAFRLGMTLPVQRAVGFGVPIWLLAPAGLVGIQRMTMRGVGSLSTPLRGLARAGCSALAVCLVGAGFVRGALDWQSHAFPSFSETDVVREVRAANAYLDSLPEATPVIVPVEFGGPEVRFGLVPAFRRIRALVAPSRVDDVVVYLGDPDLLLRGVPSLRGDAQYDAISRRYWGRISSVVRDPRAVMLGIAPYTPGVARIAAERPSARVTQGVVVLRGPLPRRPVPLASLPRPMLTTLLARSAVILAFLLVVGLGWTAAMPGADAVLSVALAPAVGVVAVASGGALAASMGLGAWSLPFIPFLMGAPGWFLATRRRLGGGSPDQPGRAAPTKCSQ